MSAKQQAAARVKEVQRRRVEEPEDVEEVSEEEPEESSEEEEQQQPYDDPIEQLQSKLVRKEGKMYLAIIDGATDTVLQLLPVQHKNITIKKKESSSATKQ